LCDILAVSRARTGLSALAVTAHDYLERPLNQRADDPVGGLRKRQKPRPEPTRSASSKRTKLSLDRLESDREALLRRLSHLNSGAKLLPGYRSALILLNSRFRRANLATRLALLQAAQFMVEGLERSPY
jgi:hypothetical protein